jgi:hypothetical protein
MDSLLFIGPNKAYVGVAHGKNLRLSDDDARKLKQIAERYGAFYEGSGGDLSAVSAIPRAMYRGSWDDAMQKNVSGYPPEFLFTLFTNVKVNKQNETLIRPSKTIFESILAAQDKISALKNRKFDANTLEQFLRSASEKDINLLALSQQPASQDNVRQFLRSGEQLMWPNAVAKEYMSKAGKLAKKVNDQRQKFLNEQPTGVFVVGSDHIQALKKLATEKLGRIQPAETLDYRDPFAPTF